jgi:ankyrin repeat protein
MREKSFLRRLASPYFFFVNAGFRCALRKGCRKLAIFFVKIGAQVDQENNQQSIPLINPESLIGYPKVNIFLISASLKRLPLHRAILDNNLELVKILLHNENMIHSINSQDLYGNTALLLAMKVQNIEIVFELFLHPEIDLYKKNHLGESVFTLAKDFDNIEIQNRLSELSLRNHQRDHTEFSSQGTVFHSKISTKNCL